MKRAFFALLCTAVLAGCSHYKISDDPSNVLPKWNADVPDPALRLETQGNANVMRSGTGLWVIYDPDKRSWMVMAPAPLARAACTELLSAVAGVAKAKAPRLIDQLSESNHWIVKDGNLELSYQSAGGLICTVADTSRH
ncbi:MAG TPA: hypothetical protein VFG49_12830 [Dyella sp.]|uniref:hypothetical protein n=1 Tax=Dyella sp. TaxID=1869338 RepID=UPI002D783904|nr:hypothetical protein [Dyella sp.]HET6554409.1 hypothetical protein [Dyella sp.]